jgi:hypothetical protein
MSTNSSDVTEAKGMAAKHTPGPWVLRGSDNATPHILHQQHDNPEQDISDPDQLVCILPAEITRSYNSWANARLIASAPESHEANKLALMVLCALEKANDWHPNMQKDIAFAIEANRAAIAKATQA